MITIKFEHITTWIKQNSYYLIIIGGISGLVFISLFEPTLDQPVLKEKELPDFSFYNLTISEVENEKTNWELKAKNASIHKKKHKTMLSLIKE